MEINNDEVLKASLDVDIQDGIMKEREMQSYIEQLESEIAEWESAWKVKLSRREVSCHSFHPELLRFYCGPCGEYGAGASRFLCFRVPFDSCSR
ncbi:hypothetical protein CASFOL_034255 [Castilleja foliolosa]|uniref:Uncharacterized protein n=1 Tax=Castilleja foliolosa TaxID=1961234 RepID=A0ABD3BYA4_9LAMI